MVVSFTPNTAVSVCLATTPLLAELVPDNKKKKTNLINGMEKSVFKSICESSHLETISDMADS